MSTTSTITVACPRCDGPAIITHTTLTVGDATYVVEFACAQGHAVTAAEAMQLWNAAHEQRPPSEGMSCPSPTA